MTVHTPDYVRVSIDGTDRTDYVIAYNRESSICSFADTFAIEFNFDIPVDPEPYDSVVIRELYDGDNEKVLSGYFIDIVQTGDRGSFIANGQDKTLLLDDYFIPEQVFSNGQSAVYWINWYANQVGLSVQYDAKYVSAHIVEEGTPMGMITCSEGLAMLERLAAVYIKWDASLDKLIVFRINTSEPVMNITNDHTTRFQRELGTEKTRNKVKVYGGYQYNIFTGVSTQVFSTAITNISELIVDKTVVMANPLIKRHTVANIVASRILEVVDDVDDILQIETAGFYPEVDVGDYASINIGRGDFTYSTDREVTSIQTSVDTAGAITIFVVGEKCPRISILPPLSIVYATSTNGGIKVSYDGGDSFAPFNKGIVSAVSEVATGLNGKSIAANKYGQLMAIVGNSLYKRSGKFGSWSEVTITDPSNDEGLESFSVTDLTLVKVEKESASSGKFHMMASANGLGSGISPQDERWWVYWTPNHGTSWNSMQLYVPGSGIRIGTPSGLPIGLINGVGITQAELQATTSSGAVTWSVKGLDIEGASSGNVTVLVGKPEPFQEEELPLEIYVAQDYIGGGAVRCCVYDGTTLDIQQYVGVSGHSITARMWSCPSDRDIAYMAAISNDGPDSTYSGAHTFLWKTTDGGTNWYEVWNELLQPDGDDSPISSYSVNFDPSSNSNEVRVGFVGFLYLADSYYRANAKFINSDPFGSATRTDDTEDITLTGPTLTGGETFGGFVHGFGATAVMYNTADKSCRENGTMWGTLGTYGPIFNGPRSDTARNALVVELDFSTKTVAEFNQYTWRTGDTNDVPCQIKAYSSVNSSTIYVAINWTPSLHKVTSTSWVSKGSVGGVGHGGFPRYNSFSEPVFWKPGGYPDYAYSIMDRDGDPTVIDFYPENVGYLNRQHATVSTKQFDASSVYWCFSDSVVLGEPDGFCYSEDNAVTWIQHWGYQAIGVYDFDWKTFA